MSPRNPPKLPPVSEQMKAWASALAAESEDWPHVSTRSFFGFTALYRKDVIFAMLPRTRGMDTANSLAFKLENPTAAMRQLLEADPRRSALTLGTGRWFIFELSSNGDLHDALDWLHHAYQAAGKKEPLPKKKLFRKESPKKKPR